MANDESSTGFLSRWSRRKSDVREGRPLVEPGPVPDLPTQATMPNASLIAPVQAEAPSEGEVKPTPTLAEAQELTPESDFSGFMARGVAPDVKNAAVKKLFTDPHFNVMDGMDVYVGDYSQSDPLPMAMLRQMATAKTLKLFDEDPTRQPSEQPIEQSTPSNNHKEPDSSV